MTNAAGTAIARSFHSSWYSSRTSSSIRLEDRDAVGAAAGRTLLASHLRVADRRGDRGAGDGDAGGCVRVRETTVAGDDRFQGAVREARGDRRVRHRRAGQAVVDRDLHEVAELRRREA